MIEPCAACGAKPPKGRGLSGSLCGNCWQDRVPFEVKAEFVQAEAFVTSDEVPERYQEALRALIQAARLTYRGEVLRKLWKKTWKRKFKAKFGIEHEVEKIPEESEEEPAPADLSFLA